MISLILLAKTVILFFRSIEAVLYDYLVVVEEVYLPPLAICYANAFNLHIRIFLIATKIKHSIQIAYFAIFERPSSKSSQIDLE